MTSSLAIDPSIVVWSVPESARAKELTTRPLLVLMHGRGSHERDLYALAPMLPPQFVIAALRAPIELAPGSYSCFRTESPLGRVSRLRMLPSRRSSTGWIRLPPLLRSRFSGSRRAVR